MHLGSLLYIHNVQKMLLRHPERIKKDVLETVLKRFVLTGERPPFARTLLPSNLLNFGFDKVNELGTLKQRT